MVLIDRIKELSKTKKIIISCALLAVIAAAVVIYFVFFRGGYYATTMRLLRVEGTVTIEDSSGKSKPVIDNIRFQSGDALNTGSDGLASVGLDDTKIVTLQSDSRAEFYKKGKQLELKLTKGALYFEVTEHLQDDESFEIKTSTMTVGIRGTSGYVFYDEDGREALVITDGKVHVVARNPETGEIREKDVNGGQLIKVYLYSDRDEGSIEFFLDDLEEDEIPAFSVKMLAENPELLKRVCEDTGWSEEDILAFAELLKDPDHGDLTITPTPAPLTDTPTPPVSTTPPPPSDTPTPPPDSSTPPGSPTPVPPGVTPTPDPTPDPNPPSDPLTPEGSPTPAPTPDPEGDPTPSPEGTPTPPPPTPTDTPTPTPPPPTPTDTPTPTPPPPTPTDTPTPTPTDTPTPTPTDTPTPTPTDTPTPTPTDIPTPTPNPIPDHENLPEGFMEEIEWLEDDRVFILMGNYPDDDSGDPVYLGYVDGEWIELDCLVTETADGYIEEYSYVKNGKTVLYYTRI